MFDTVKTKIKPAKDQDSNDELNVFNKVSSAQRGCIIWSKIQ